MYNDTGSIITMWGAPPTSAPAGNKKRGVVVGIVLAIAIVCAVGLTIFILILSKPTQGKMREAFNVYGNFLLRGEKSAEDLTGEHVHANTYQIEKVLTGSRDDITAYYEEANRLFGEFIKLYDGTISEAEDMAEFRGYVESQRQLFGFAYKYAVSEIMTDQMVLGKYLAEGEDGAKLYVKNNYNSFVDDNNELIKEFGELKTEQFELQIKTVNIYRDEGCIRNGEMDSACVRETTYGGGREDAARLAELRRQTSLLVGTHHDDLLEGCWSISNVLANAGGA